MRKPGDEIDSIELTRCADAVIAWAAAWKKDGWGTPPWPADAKMDLPTDPFPYFDRETVYEATLMLVRLGEIVMRPKR